MIKLVITLIIIAGVVYYYNLDIIRLVEKSGIPEWLEKEGFVTKNSATKSLDATTSPGSIQE